jgi:hypothetical protein
MIEYQNGSGIKQRSMLRIAFNNLFAAQASGMSCQLNIGGYLISIYFRLFMQDCVQ